MGYFQADERYQGTGPGGTVAAPWNVQIGEGGAVERVRLTWRAPYSPVDSYGIYGQAVEGGAGWQEWARIPAPAGEVLLTLAPGAWRLCLTARRGTTDSAPTPELRWRVEPPLPPLPIALPEPVVAIAPAPPVVLVMPIAPAPVPLTQPPAPAIANPQPTRGTLRASATHEGNPAGFRNPPAPEPEFDWTALDQALHANQAQLGRHGLFVRRRP